MNEPNESRKPIVVSDYDDNIGGTPGPGFMLYVAVVLGAIVWLFEIFKH